MREGDEDKPAYVNAFKGHRATITSLCFNPNGKQLASSGCDGSIMMWNLTSARNSLRFLGKKTAVTRVSFSPTGDLMASSQGVYVTLWVPTIKGKCSEMKCHSTRVRSVEFSSDGKTLLTASDDKSVKIWNASTQRFVSSFTGHTNWVNVARYNCDGSTVVSCSADKTVRLWDPRANVHIHTFAENRGTPNYVEFHPSGNFVGVGMSHCVVKLYDVRANSLLQYYMCHTDQINSLAFHPSGNFLLSASKDSTARIIDLVEGHALYTLQFEKGSSVTDIAFSNCGRHFATSTTDKQVRMWKTNMSGVGCGAKSAATRTKLRQSMAADNCNNATQLSCDDDDSGDDNVARSQFDNDQKIQDVYCADDYREREESENAEELDAGEDDHSPAPAPPPSSNGAPQQLHNEITGEDSGRAVPVDGPEEERSAPTTGDKRPADDNAPTTISYRQLLFENEELRMENATLREELDQLEHRLRVLKGVLFK